MPRVMQQPDFSNAWADFMRSLQSLKLGLAVLCCVTGLEWEEIEPPEGPALLSLQPSAPNGQVATNYVNAQTVSGIHRSITEQCIRPQDLAAG